MDAQLQSKIQEAAFGKPVYIPSFFMHATVDSNLTARHGITIYSEALYIKIRTKGRKDNTVRKATQDDIDLFQEAYQKFLTEDASPEQSLETLPGYTASIGFTFRDLGVTTVDELLAFKGPFPLAEMKKLWHVARYITTGLEAYQPPVFKDDPKKEQFHGSQEAKLAARLYAQRDVSSGGVGESVPVIQPPGQQGGGGQIPQFGVNLDEEGNRQVEVNGKTFAA